MRSTVVLELGSLASKNDNCVTCFSNMMHINPLFSGVNPSHLLLIGKRTVRPLIFCNWLHGCIFSFLRLSIAGYIS